MTGSRLDISEAPCQEQSLELSAVNIGAPLCRWVQMGDRYVTPRVCQGAHFSGLIFPYVKWGS